uniref:Uncharacterized protein n=1 Tax=Panagrolaimus davidi TaxID=227884 RepID=A0A914PU03_9BILA
MEMVGVLSISLLLFATFQFSDSVECPFGSGTINSSGVLVQHVRLGPPELRDDRIFIADYNLPRAQRRLQVALKRSKKPANEKALRRQELHKWIHSLQLHGSQTAGLRAVSFCEF